MIIGLKKTSCRFGEIEIHKNNKHAKSVNSFNTTPYFSELLTYAGQACCYANAEESVNRLLRIETTAMKVHRITNHYGQLAETIAVPKAKMPAPDESVYVGVNGSFIFTRKGWKEVKAGRIFMGKKDSKGYIRHSEYESVIGTKGKFVERFEKKLEGYQFLRERLIFVTDGATWIKKWIDDTFPQATQILDYYHACEYLHNFANEYFTESEKKIKKRWTDTQKKSLKNSQVQKVIENTKELPVRRKSAKAKRKLLKYYRDNIQRMDYKAYKEMGAGIIGSGAIEAAHRNLIQKRLKQSGQRWTKEGAQRVLNLRCLNLSNHWDQVQALIRNDTAMRLAA